MQLGAFGVLACEGVAVCGHTKLEGNLYKLMHTWG